jgi:hypothetical protein
MMDQFGYIDISYEEIQNYLREVNKKTGICKILPRARMQITKKGLLYDGLICSPEDMNGSATGVSAECCKNCLLKN